MRDWNEHYQHIPRDKEYHLNSLEAIANNTFFYNERVKLALAGDWLGVAVTHNHAGAIDVLLDALEISMGEDLTLKQRLAIYYLSHTEKDYDY